MRRIVIIGGGTAGTLAANRLRRALPVEAADIVVVDADDRHVYQPGLLFVPFGKARPEDLVRPRRAQLRPSIDFRRVAVDQVSTDRNEVLLAGGDILCYDILIIASGAALLPEETEGLTGPGWMERVFTFYDLPGAIGLAAALDRFTGGRLVINVIDLPIKCPVAPLEFGFLADEYFRRRGLRDRVEIRYVTPLDGAFTKPAVSRELGGLLADKGIELVTEFNTGEVDGTTGKLVSYDGREEAFDLAVVVPLHGGAGYMSRSPGLGDELGFVSCDERTLVAKASPDVFVIGDAAGLPASKAGSVAHFEGEVLVRNVLRRLAGEPPDAVFDGHANCFIESGFGKALLIDFNYDTEPLPGRFPSRVGLPLLRQSRLNHLGKLAFSRLYWHVLLPGREIPGVPSRMPVTGKHITGKGH
ncbi:MAG TPA: FAD/NAD(P)-binding oxidoreductase [Streptosporangiaceae bacterium]|nr:FAD/NAD(P)-binding oxidoreductase [Streptosporangiaceae bacterium]